jgi:hypothetical protein
MPDDACSNKVSVEVKSCYFSFAIFYMNICIHIYDSPFLFFNTTELLFAGRKRLMSTMKRSMSFV